MKVFTFINVSSFYVADTAKDKIDIIAQWYKCYWPSSGYLYRSGNYNTKYGRLDCNIELNLL